MSVDSILDAIREVSAEIVEPRFRSLHAGEIDAKSPGDYVTIVDREAERALTKYLLGGDSRAIVVGEESCFYKPELTDAVGKAEHCFVVDPLDGTNNFVRGSEDFAMMLAELRGPETVSAWIWQPRSGKAFIAQHGAGTWCNGKRVNPTPLQEPPQGACSNPAWHGMTQGNLIAPVIASSRSCGIDYPRIVTGDIDFAVYRVARPWDHLPGQLMLQELGGDVVHLDGRKFGPGTGKMSALSCRNAAVGRTVAQEWPSWSAPRSVK